MRIIICDDASGIAEAVIEDDDGTARIVDRGTPSSIDGLSWALRIGGRIQGQNRIKTGRFGFGLPQTILSFLSKGTVYSHIRDGVWERPFFQQITFETQ